MPELGEAAVFELDHPASQQDKQQRVDGLAPMARTLAFVPADLAQVDIGSALETHGHDSSQPTTWILEGVIPYLTEEQAAATVESIAGRSAPGSALVLTYQASSAQGGVVRFLARVAFVLMGRGDPMAKEQRRSSWSAESVQDLLVDAGFFQTDSVELAALARQVGVPDRHVQSSHVAVGAMQNAH